MKHNEIIVITMVALMLAAAGAQGGINGPYMMDTGTLHLWHLDSTTLPATDEAAGGLALNYLGNSATLGNSSFTGFGSALKTALTPRTTTANPYLAAVQHASGTGDNVTLALAGADGAFTFEAIIRLDFDPAAIQTASPGSLPMQIISGEGDTAERIFQWRLMPASSSQPLRMEFINVRGGSNTQTLAAAIPAGDDAAVQNGWYHVAVSYNGLEATAGNLTLYWTRLDESRMQAVALFSGQMTYDLITGPADFTIGNEGRSTGGSSDNFIGLIDEVRISSVARTGGQMLFNDNGPKPPVITVQPQNLLADEGQVAGLVIQFDSETPPAAVWMKTGRDGTPDLPVNLADPAYTVLLNYSASNGYTSQLILNGLTSAMTGGYYCAISNESSLVRTSDTVFVQVRGLLARWTLDQAGYHDGYYQELVNQRHALASGTPQFVDGADGRSGAAVRVTPQNGWAVVDSFDAIEGTGRLTLSLWARWQDTTVAQEDISLTALPTPDQLTAPDGLKSQNRWQHVCAVFDGAAAAIYLDGQPAARGAWTLPTQTTALLHFGADGSGLNSFVGDLDDIRVYNVALTPFAVADLYHDMTGRSVCLLAYSQASDPTGPQGAPDCRVDINDLAWYVQRWPVEFDLNGFGNLASNWLSCGLYPECQ